MVAGSFVFNAIEGIIYNCKPPDPFGREWCGAPRSISVLALLSILIGPWLVATYLLARREAIVPFACVFLGLMSVPGFLTFLVLLVPGPLDITFLPIAVVGGATVVMVIGFLTAVVGSVAFGGRPRMNTAA